MSRFFPIPQTIIASGKNFTLAILWFWSLIFIKTNQHFNSENDYFFHEFLSRFSRNSRPKFPGRDGTNFVPSRSGNSLLLDPLIAMRFLCSMYCWSIQGYFARARCAIAMVVDERMHCALSQFDSCTSWAPIAITAGFYFPPSKQGRRTLPQTVRYNIFYQAVGK